MPMKDSHELKRLKTKRKSIQAVLDTKTIEIRVCRDIETKLKGQLKSVDQQIEN